MVKTGQTGRWEGRGPLSIRGEPPPFRKAVHILLRVFALRRPSGESRSTLANRQNLSKKNCWRLLAIVCIDTVRLLIQGHRHTDDRNGRAWPRRGGARRAYDRGGLSPCRRAAPPFAPLASRRWPVARIVAADRYRRSAGEISPRVKSLEPRCRVQRRRVPRRETPGRLLQCGRLRNPPRLLRLTAAIEGRPVSSVSHRLAGGDAPMPGSSSAFSFRGSAGP
jgi:hypothetical protein